MSKLSVLLDPELLLRAVCVYLILNEYADNDGYCFPSLKTITQGSGLSKSTVQRAINDLEKVCFIEKGQQLWQT